MTSWLQSGREVWLRTTITASCIVTGVVGVFAFQPTASAPVTPDDAVVFAAAETQQLSVPLELQSQLVSVEAPAVIDGNAPFTPEELEEIQALADEEEKPSGNPFGAGTEYAEVLELLDNTTVQSPFHGSTFPSVTSGYGPRWGKFHYGSDYGARSGTKLYAISYGIVTYQYRDSMGANVLTVDHMIDGQRYRTLYAHMLDDADKVEPGQIVTPNQVISAVGSTGFSTGPHLHFEIMLDDAATIDPHVFLTEGEHEGRRERNWSVDPNDNHVGLPPDYEDKEEEEAEPEEDARPEDPDPSEEPKPSEEPDPSEDPDPSDPGPLDPEPSDPEPSEGPTPSESPSPSAEPTPSTDPEG